MSTIFTNLKKAHPKRIKFKNFGTFKRSQIIKIYGFDHPVEGGLFSQIIKIYEKNGHPTVFRQIE